MQVITNEYIAMVSRRIVLQVQITCKISVIQWTIIMIMKTYLSLKNLW